MAAVEHPQLKGKKTANDDTEAVQWIVVQIVVYCNIDSLTEYPSSYAGIISKYQILVTKE